MGPNVNSPMPPEHVHAFLGLVDALERELDEVIDPIRTRLMETLVASGHAAQLDGPRPTVRVMPANAFEPRTSRTRYPVSHPTTSAVNLANEPPSTTFSVDC